MAQDKEKGKLEENRTQIIDRTKAIIEQAGKMRSAPVGARPLPPEHCFSGALLLPFTYQTLQEKIPAHLLSSA